MKVFLSLLFLSVSFLLTAEEELSTTNTLYRKLHYRNGTTKSIRAYQKNTDNKWVRQGAEENFFPDGTLKSKGSVLEGKKTGFWTLLTKEGELSQGYYTKDLKTGPWEVQSKNGNVIRREFYVQGKLSGVQEQFDKNGTLVFKAFFKEGRLHGHQQTWYTSGKQATSSYWIEGKENGTFQGWSEKGKTLFIKQFAIGKPTSTWYWYDSEGNLLHTTNFENGTGLVYEYDYRVLPKEKQPILVKEIPFVEGLIHGIVKIYGPNGTPYIYQEYSHGKKHGKFKEIFSDSSPKVQGQFANNFPSGEWKVYQKQDGQNFLLQVKSYLEDGRSNLITFTNKGKKVSEENYLGEHLDGEYSTYFDNGGLKATGQYVLGKKEGIWREFFSNGSPKSRKSFMMDQPHGPFQEWFESSQGDKTQLKNKGAFVLGQKSGQWEEWDAHGNPVIKVSYRYGLLDGAFEEYWPVKQQSATSYKKIEGTYQRNHKIGTWKKWYENGLQASEGNYTNGLEDGTFKEWFNFLVDGSPVVKFEGTFELGQKKGDWISYYRNGKTKHSETFLNNSLHGKISSFYETGPLKQVVYYEFGNPEGEESFYHANGKLKSRAYYKDGVKEGSYTKYHFNGELAQKGSFVRGVPEGNWQWYSDDGDRSTFKSSFKEGTGVMYTVFNNGKVKKETELLAGLPHGKEKRYFSSGQLRSVADFEQGLLHGKYLEYHDNGTLIEESSWYYGQPHGQHLTWYGNKKEKENLNYTYSLLDGAASDWYENGNLKSEGSWKLGFKDGPWKWFDRYGKKIYSEDYKVGALTYSSKRNEQESVQ